MGLPRIESGLWAKTDQSFPPFNHLAIVYGAVTQYHEHTARLLRGRLQDDTTNDTGGTLMLTDELGSEIIVDEKDKFVMRTKMCDTMLQPNGIIHGGISAYLAESAANLCVMHHVEDPEHMFPVGLELTSSHLLPVMPGDTVETVATPIREGGRIRVWEIKQYRMSDGELFNRSQLTMYVKIKRD